MMFKKIVKKIIIIFLLLLLLLVLTLLLFNEKGDAVGYTTKVLKLYSGM